MRSCLSGTILSILMQIRALLNLLMSLCTTLNFSVPLFSPNYTFSISLIFSFSLQTCTRVITNNNVAGLILRYFELFQVNQSIKHKFFCLDMKRTISCIVISNVLLWKLLVSSFTVCILLSTIAFQVSTRIAIMFCL